MATIYYCKICQNLLVDEDDLPTKGTYCSRKCEKIFDNFGLEAGRKEYKKREREQREVNNIQNSPAAESIPVRTSKKKPNIVEENRTSFITNIFRNKRDENDNFDNETSKYDLKKKKKGSNKSEDYESSMEYFRKIDPDGNIIRDKKPNEQRPNREQSNTPPQQHIPSSQQITPPPQQITPPPQQITPPPQQNPQTSQPLYPDLKEPLENLNDLIYATDIDHSEPPPSYDTIFPNPPPQVVKVDEKELRPQPSTNKEKKEKIIINIDKKQDTITASISTTSTASATNTDINKTKPIVTTKKPPKSPKLPPRVPPKVPIPSPRNETMPITPPLNQQDSGQFGQFPPNHRHPSYYQPHNDTPGDTFFQDQATLPPSIYPPPFYTTRFGQNNS